jgi:hypothetical protein
VQFKVDFYRYFWRWSELTLFASLCGDATLVTPERAPASPPAQRNLRSPERTSVMYLAAEDGRVLESAPAKI